MRVASIDLGTNTVLLTVAEQAGAEPRPLVERSTIVRLGRGLKERGRLDPERAELTLSVLADYAEVARAHGVERVAAVATSALRRADDGAEFIRTVAARTGIELRVIGGDEEARLSYLAQARDPLWRGHRGPLRVVDIGGGSTEVVLGQGGVVRHGVSLEIGSVRLAEACIEGEGAPGEAARETMLERARAVIEAAALPRDAAPLVAVAGTATTLATMALELRDYDPERVHGHRLSRAALAGLSRRLVALDLAARKALPGVEPARADVLPAGACILEALLDHLGAPEVAVSDRGLRWGLVYELFDAAGR